MENKDILVIGVIALVLFGGCGGNSPLSTKSYGDPNIPVIYAAVQADREKVQLPDTLGPSASAAPAEKPEVPKEVIKREVVVYTIDNCPHCVMPKNAVRDMHKKGWKEDQVSIRHNTTNNSIGSFPTTIVYSGGKEVHRITGPLNAQTLADFYTNLTASELRQKIKSYTGGITYVNPPTIEGYKSHICDPGQHNGAAYKRSQLNGLSISELQKLHGAQHNGIYYGP
jgi:glutaredoxin